MQVGRKTLRKGSKPAAFACSICLFYLFIYCSLTTEKLSVSHLNKNQYSNESYIKANS